MAAAKCLHETSGEQLPTLLLSRYNLTKNWAARASLIMRALKYSRTSEDAVKLALDALSDKSKIVRYRACMFLAVAQRAGLLKVLTSKVDGYPSSSREDHLAAIDAFEARNQHYFIDRDHSRRTFLDVWK